jgi:Fic family protein
MVQISPLDPVLPSRESLEPLVLEVFRASGFSSSLPEPTERAIRDAVRIAEAHYSLAIDGHRVHPAHIEQGTRGDLDPDAKVRGLQREAVAYLKSERFVATRLTGSSPAELPSSAFLKVIHWELYTRVPEEFRWVSDPDSPGSLHRIVPGEFRTHAGHGHRSSPSAESIETVMQRFKSSYDPSRLGAMDRVLAAAAAHHRLLWIHPFAGGNGRVARLFTAAYLERAGVEGALGGIWSMSRGLARARERYRALLAAADTRQRHELEGRDLLSPRGLLEFTRFFFEACREELAYMRRVLRAETLIERITQYVNLRTASMAPGGVLHSEAASLLRDVALRGELPRGEAARITGMPVSEARKVLSSLVKDRLLVSDSPKGPVRLCLPAHAAPFLFPDLYDGDLVFRQEPRSVIEAA